MMDPSIIDSLNINVTHFTPGPEPTPIGPVTPGSPDTGFFNSLGNFISHVGVTGWCFIALAALLIAVSIVFFCLQRRYHNKAYMFLSAFFVAATIGFTIPAVHSVSSALGEALLHTTDFNIEAQTVATPTTIRTEFVTLPEDLPYGYRLFAILDTTHEDNALYNADGTNKIDAIPEATASPEFFPDNTYGVKSLVEDDTYLPIKYDDIAVIVDTNEPVAAGTPIAVTYAAKLDQNTPVDTYSGQIKYYFSAKPAPTLSSLSAEGATMQDKRMHDACVNTPAYEENYSYPFTDSRDGKSYNVAKLQDGNCWMVENLRLGSATQDTQLTPDDSNIQEDWTLPAMPLDTNWPSDNTAYTSPYFYPSDDIQEDASKGAIGYYGYYYNWNAATAGTGYNTTMEAQYDICPKGWSLPSDYSTEEGKTRSYAKLLLEQGVINTIPSIHESVTYANKDKMFSSPLRFVLSGDHGTINTSIYDRGSRGHHWSRSSNNSTLAYKLEFDDTKVNPQNAYSKRYGYVVRCLAL